MNRYPLWKYIIILIVLVLSLIYSISNIFGETPAVQISTNRQSVELNEQTEKLLLSTLHSKGIQTDGSFFSDGSLKIRFKDTDTQSKAKDIITEKLGNHYIVALNLVTNTPEWMTKINAKPMFLGLDLRGGVHFLMEVDMSAALQKKMDSYSSDIRRKMRQAKIRIGNVKISNNTLSFTFQNQEKLQEALQIIQKDMPNIELANGPANSLILTVKPEEILSTQNDAISQNISTLHNRVNELGVAEPIIMQAGENRILVQLPGVQDTAKAKDIIGRTATLEIHLVNGDEAALRESITGNIPNGFELLYESGPNPAPILINQQVELTGDEIANSQPSWDEQNRPAVALKLTNIGAQIFGDLTRENVNKRIALVLIDQDKKEVVTAPVVRVPITQGNVQISGNMNLAEANDIALLLRAGSLAAPMKIIEERTIGPSLGQDNINKGFNSTLWGFVLVACFMIIYYRGFGVISSISLSCNVLMLIALLSLIQATLTLPGIAAIALTLGMAIDSNVLINERIREELRAGLPPQHAIYSGFSNAWRTILDSNITSLIAGLSLLIFSGAGPIRGFAVVHCLGILTTLFSSVVISRALVNIWYGKRNKLEKISIGTVYKPKTIVDKD